MGWMVLPLKRYVDFAGRSRRLEFWMFWLFTIIVQVAAGALDWLLGFGSTYRYVGPNGTMMGAAVGDPIGSIASLLLLIPSIAVAIRRLHDTDRRGWWLLLVLIPFLGWLALFVFYVLDGTRGPNRFGPDPKNPTGDLRDIFG